MKMKDFNPLDLHLFLSPTLLEHFDVNHLNHYETLVAFVSFMSLQIGFKLIVTCSGNDANKLMDHWPNIKLVCSI